MTDVILNQKAYTKTDLIELSLEAEVQKGLLTPYDKKVLDFCQCWLRGQTIFTINTSGSTGEPKAIDLTRGQMIASARLTGEALQLEQGDKALVCLGVDYIAGLMMLVRGFVLGLDLVVVPPTSNPVKIFVAENNSSPTQSHLFDFTAVVPLQLATILADGLQSVAVLNGMKGILVGGAPLNPQMNQAIQELTVPLYHTYGMTETATHIALKQLNGPQTSPDFIPLPGVRVGLDERGCLTVAGPMTNGRRLVTNDLVDLKADGRFRWLGRVDHVINSGGVKVQIETVEVALGEVLYALNVSNLAERRFLVGAIEDDRLGQKVVAVVEGEAPTEKVEQLIKGKLQQTLSPYEVPKTICFLKQLAETPTGKIDRLTTLKQIEGTV